MATKSLDADSNLDAVESLRAEIEQLNERIATLEASASTKPAAPPKTLPPAAADVIPTDELMLVIAAAVAAYLGVKPHIRQIHLVNNISWAQQGRVTIQASHILESRHG